MAKKDKKTTKKIIPVAPVENNIVDAVLPAATKESKKEKKKNTPKVKGTTKKDKKDTPVKKVKKVKTPQEKVIKKDAIGTLIKFFGSVKAKHLSDVFIDLMTEKEIQEFAERVEILKLLKAGVTQRVIAKKLGISVTTVSRGSKVLQTGKQTIKKYL